MNAGRAYRILSAGPALLLVMCLVCCSAPDTWEMFVKNTGDGDRSEYIFPLKMSDSLAIYDIELFTRLDISDAAFAALPEVIPFNITYTSPSGTGYYEEAGIPKYDDKIDPEQSVTFGDSVKDQMRTMKMYGNYNTALQELSKELRKEADIKYFDGDLD